MLQSTRGRKPGQWWPIKTNGVISANYYCSKCGIPMGLQFHQITKDGRVDPSVICPHPIYAANPPTSALSNEDMRMPAVQCSNCDFHECITLIGWNDL